MTDRISLFNKLRGMDKIKDYKYPWIVIVMLAFIAISFTILDYYTPSMGDDLGKWNDLGLESYNFFSYSTIKFIGSHYLACNGRIIDSVGPVITNALPHLVASILMGIMAAFYFWMILVSLNIFKRRYITLQLVIITCAILLIPWWDSMWLRVCQFGYIWSTSFCLLFFVLFCKKNYLQSLTVFKSLLLIAIGILTGFCHEQTGICSSCALIVYLIINKRYKSLSKTQLILSLSLFLGTAFALMSPMLWHRIETSVVLVSTSELLWTTLPVACLLLIIIAIMIIFESGKKRLRYLLTTTWPVYVTITLTGGAISIFSHIIGRTGILPETAAIISIILIFKDITLTIPKSTAVVVSSLLIIMVTVHFVGASTLQYKLSKEYQEVFDKYINSEDGIVCYDVTYRTDFPILALNHAQGVPDADDFYLLSVLGKVYRKDSVMLTVLPKQFYGKVNTFQDSLTYDGFTLFDKRPKDVTFAISENGMDTITIINRNDRDLILFPRKTSRNRLIYIASPLIIDKGDHWIRIENLE